jgi:hypothetical protein
MVNGQLEKARHQLSMAETWRHGRLSESQSQRVKLVQAYRSLLDYFTWCDKRENFSTAAGKKNTRKGQAEPRKTMRNGLWRAPYHCRYPDFISKTGKSI